MFQTMPVWVHLQNSGPAEKLGNHSSICLLRDIDFKQGPSLRILHVKLIGDLNLTIDVDVTGNGCLSLRVSPAIYWSRMCNASRPMAIAPMAQKNKTETYLLLNFSGCFSLITWKRCAIEAS